MAHKTDVVTPNQQAAASKGTTHRTIAAAENCGPHCDHGMAYTPAASIAIVWPLRTLLIAGAQALAWRQDAHQLVREYIDELVSQTDLLRQ